ncbi:MAG TPA: hypothetical protein PLC16_02890 [Defluviitaleaceae bacterium]|nr:hypothetical protein [Defluviitaleaceae bacterium]HPT75669.1 hypothetical protein [Defluviitaleaceae bacterium]
MAFENGLFSFLLIMIISFILTVIGIILLVIFKNKTNGLRFIGFLLISIAMIMILFSKKLCLDTVRVKETVDVAPMTELKFSSILKVLKRLWKALNHLTNWK